MAEHAEPWAVKLEVVREYAGRVEVLDTFPASAENYEEAKALAVAKGGYVFEYVNGWYEDGDILFEAEGRTHFYDNIGDHSWWEED